LLGLTVYVVWKWSDVTEFTFFSAFNGRHLLFVVWIILIVLPIISKFVKIGVGPVTVEPAADVLEKKVDKIEAETSTSIPEKEGLLATVTQKEETRNGAQ